MSRPIGEERPELFLDAIRDRVNIGGAVDVNYRKAKLPRLHDDVLREDGISLESWSAAEHRAPLRRE